MVSSTLAPHSLASPSVCTISARALSLCTNSTRTTLSHFPVPTAAPSCQLRGLNWVAKLRSGATRRSTGPKLNSLQSQFSEEKPIKFRVSPNSMTDWLDDFIIIFRKYLSWIGLKEAADSPQRRVEFANLHAAGRGRRISTVHQCAGQTGY